VTQNGGLCFSAHVIKKPQLICVFFSTAKNKVVNRQSVSKMIQKLPLTEAQTALGKQNKIRRKRFSIWRMEFFHPAMWPVALGWDAVEFAQTFTILEFYIWFRFQLYHHSRHVILHQSAKFYPDQTTHHRKMASSRGSV